MTIDEFRIKHSTLIEQYQFIEFRLKGIYAVVSGKNFFEGLDDVEESNMGKLIIEIKKFDSQRNVPVIAADLYDRIESVRLKRNYWSHNCYTSMAFKTNGDPKNEEKIKELKKDLREAEDLRNILYEIFMEIGKELRL